MTIVAVSSNTVYNTTVLVSDSENGTYFDNNYKAYLENEKLGELYIEYDKNLEDYKVEAKFKKAGKTNLIIEDPTGNKTIYEIEIKRNSYDITKK